MTSAVGPWGAGAGCSDQTYEYDQNGNRICKGESGTTNYTYSSTSNRLTSYGYDANGNTTGDGTHTYGYSDANRLATVDGDWTWYDYDGENRRVRKSNAQTTHFFYDRSGRILTTMIHNEEAYGGGNGFGQDYIYLPDAPIARVDWSVVNNPAYQQCHPPRGGICPPPRIAIADLLYYHTDHLGTPLAMTNESGGLVWKAEYLPFGELFSNTISTVGNNLRFPGQYFDYETGLHQNWFRDYSPKTGRYVEADPIGLLGGRNQYAYANDNPVNLYDPSGMFEVKKWLTGVKTWFVGVADSAALTALWASGVGTDNYSFGSDSAMTQLMMRDPKIQEAVRYYATKNASCKDPAHYEPLTNYRAPFGLWGLGRAGLNPARQFVGSYAIFIYPNGPDSIEITLSNTTSFTSAAYDKGPSWERHPIGPFGLPGGNVEETFTWTQHYP